MITSHPIFKNKKHNNRIVSLLLLLILLISAPRSLKAQLIDSGEILRAGTEDANLLLKEYLKPFGGGFGADLNSGWFTSARPLKKFGFDLRLSVSAAAVPTQHRLFDVTGLDLRTVRLLDGPAKTPTAFGDQKETSILGATVEQSSGQKEELFSFEMPKGVGIHYVPAPMAQFSLGLPRSTQITFRYTPTVTIDQNYDFNIKGIGALVGLNPLLFDNTLPVDLSIQAGYMGLSANSRLDVEPIVDENTENPYPDSQWENQNLQFDSNTFTMNVLAGKNFSILSLYGGMGFQHAQTEIAAKGSYPIIVPDEEQNAGDGEHIESIDDPINITLDGANSVHLLGGFQLKLAFISLTATYTLAKYSTLTAGVGITFRN